MVPGKTCEPGWTCPSSRRSRMRKSAVALDRRTQSETDLLMQHSGVVLSSLPLLLQNAALAHTRLVSLVLR